jgi:hypothetical protein
LIAVSDAPVSYFFCASADPLTATVAMTTAMIVALPVVGRESIIPPGLGAEGRFSPQDQIRLTMGWPTDPPV